MEESPSLTGHAAWHNAYYQDVYTTEERLDLDQRGPPCSLSTDKCYELAVEERNWYLTKLHLDTAPQRVNTPAESEEVTALMQFGHKTEYAQYLLNLGADVNAHNTHGDSVLMHIIKQIGYVDLEAVKMFVYAGANVHVRDNEGTHLIQYAARLDEDSVQVVEMLLTAGVSVQDLGSEVNYFLLCALEYSKQSVDFVKILTEIGAEENIFKYDTSLYTALMDALVSARTSVHVVKMMIDKGLDVKMIDDVILITALMSAVRNSVTNTRGVKMMIDAGADVNAQDKDGYSALMFACESEYEVHVELVRLLLDAGADRNHQDTDGKSALMVAQEHKIVKMLIEAGADVNVKDEDGNSVLMHHIIYNDTVNLQLVKNLTEAGANLFSKNNEDKTVLTITVSLFESMLNKKEMLLIIRHLLGCPQLNQNVELFSYGANNPQKVLFDSIRCSDNFLKQKLLDILKMIIDSQFKDTRYVENIEAGKEHEYHQFMNETIVPVGSIALLLNTTFRIKNICDLQTFIQVMLDAGFDMQTGGISPLTVFILNINLNFGNNFNVEITDTQPAEGEVPQKSPDTMLIDFLIANGAHVGQQILILRYIDSDLQALREQLFLPDALLAALYTGKFICNFK
jgi:ankyrin repeat protein